MKIDLALANSSRTTARMRIQIVIFDFKLIPNKCTLVPARRRRYHIAGGGGGSAGG